MYTENQVVRVAKRENNTKRKYLVVNRLQGKHVPVLPSEALNMFYELKTLLQDTYSQERLLLIGFAETATAIGAAIATQMNCFYIQTTREIIDGVTYFFFSEAHSHATEQKLVKDDLDKVIGHIDRVIFIEDEVTTGNTIMNIISLMKKEYDGISLTFSIASIINGMDAMSEQRFHDEKIGIHYLVKTENQKYEAVADKFEGNGSYHVCSVQMQDANSQENQVRASISSQEEKVDKGFVDFNEDQDKAFMNLQEVQVKGLMNARRLCDSEQYQKACDSLWVQMKQKEQSTLEQTSCKSILVLGTEEFMYPALYVALMLEQHGKEVCFHATTRSPIMVDSEETYPLHERYELNSFYDANRVTFIYDLKKYDKVYVITDSSSSDKAGQESLVSALSMCGNDNISVIRWC